jgi:hypothetical protein
LRSDSRFPSASTRPITASSALARVSVFSARNIRSPSLGASSSLPAPRARPLVASAPNTITTAIANLDAAISHSAG